MATLTTPKLGIPYPDGAERVMDGDNAMGAMALKIDSLGLPFAMAAGTVAITLSNAAGGSVAVTFPVGRFNANPIPYASCAAGSQNYFAGTGSGTTTGTTAVVAHRDSGLASITLTVCWWAVQMTPSAGPGRAAELQHTGPWWVVTCHTGGCDNGGHAIELEYDPTNPPGGVACGVCGQPITDITTGS